jgi:hypothetical protein
VTSSAWQSFSGRQQGLPASEVLHEGVPDHLEHPMRAWIYSALQRGGAQQVALRLEIQIRPDWTPRGDYAWYLANALPALQLLDVIDAILGVGGPWPALDPLDPPFGDIEGERAAHMRWELEVMLAEGRSAYRVNDTGDGLTTRVAQASTKAFQSVVASASQASKAGSAADLLRTAWDALYVLHPDAPKAYRHAVSAVEAAAAATIEPKNSKATLGTMLGQLRSHRQQYLLAIPGPSGTGGITPLIEMMTLLWEGQTSRHGSQAAIRMETREEAEMAVHLAVVLVHWFTTGAVQPRP